MVTAQNDIKHGKVRRNATNFKKLPPSIPQLKSKATIKEVDSDSKDIVFLTLLREKKQEDLKHGRTTVDTNQEWKFWEDLLGSDKILYEETISDEQTDVDEEYCVQQRIQIPLTHLKEYKLKW